MSNAVLPDLPGIAWPVTKKPTFATKTQTAVSMRELRYREAAYPVYEIGLTFEFLRPDEFEQLCGFFLLRNGSFDSFLWIDKDDCSVTDQALGTADGSRTQWQLVRSFGGFVEPVENVNVISAIKVAGVTQSASAYTITSTGLLVFVTPPAAGSAIAWSGTFYYRCRFLDDSADFSKFMAGLWELKKLDLKGATGNKV